MRRHPLSARARIARLSLFAVILSIPFAAVPARAAVIPITAVQAYPNGRITNELPPNAIDGDTTTYTWTTNPNNTAAPSHLAIGFVSAKVNRIRLWKQRDGGGGQNIKNLTISYTTDTVLPLSSRNWIAVTNLSNGFQGTEPLDATSVNADGTVTGDIHESPNLDGWGSVSFPPVTATGLRISFSNPNPVPTCDGVTPNGSCNHYRVGEFQARLDAPVIPGAQTWGYLAMALLIAVTGGAFLRRGASRRESA